MVSDQPPVLKHGLRETAVKHWKVLVVLGVLALCVTAYVRLPALHGDLLPLEPTVFSSRLSDYFEETGHYPGSARELVAEVGPMLPDWLQLSFLRDGVVLLKSQDEEIEVEYHCVSPDRRPEVTYRRR